MGSVDDWGREQRERGGRGEGKDRKDGVSEGLNMVGFDRIEEEKNENSPRRAISQSACNREISSRKFRSPQRNV